MEGIEVEIKIREGKKAEKRKNGFRKKKCSYATVQTF
jgi:hypothetical protein